MPEMESAQRDQLLRGVRVARWTAGLGAAALTAAFSVAAAHAFKGHNGHAKVVRAPATHARVTVPGPDQVPSIANDGSLQPPQQAPQAAPPAQQQQQQQPQEQAPAQPPVSGGS